MGHSCASFEQKVGNLDGLKLYYVIDTLCFERCSKCHHWKTKSSRCVDVAKLIAFVKSAGAREFCITGGEPLIYSDDLKKIIDAVSSRVVIITNGVLAGSDFIDFIKGRDTHIVFSLDTLDKGEWLFVRGSDTMQVVLENLEYARSVLNPAQLSIQSVLAKETRHGCLLVDDYCKKYSIYHSIQYYIASGFDGEWTPCDDVYSPPADSDEPCGAVKNISIMSDGAIFTCFQQNLIASCQRPLGNVNCDAFEKIISSPYYSFVVEKMRNCRLPCKVLRCNQS